MRAEVQDIRRFLDRYGALETERALVVRGCGDLLNHVRGRYKTKAAWLRFLDHCEMPPSLADEWRAIAAHQPPKSLHHH